MDLLSFMFRVAIASFGIPATARQFGPMISYGTKQQSYQRAVLVVGITYQRTVVAPQIWVAPRSQGHLWLDSLALEVWRSKCDYWTPDVPLLYAAPKCHSLSAQSLIRHAIRFFLFQAAVYTFCTQRYIGIVFSYVILKEKYKINNISIYIYIYLFPYIINIFPESNLKKYITYSIELY